MSAPIPQDTPINRASILQMTPEQLTEHVEALQSRRLRSHTIYQAGLRAKAEAQSDKDQAQLAKVLARFEKEELAAVKKLELLEKLALDIQAIRLTLGDLG